MLNVLILNWKSSIAVKECINSVINSDFKMLRLVIINNYSDDRDLAEMRNLYNDYNKKIDILFIENSKNSGYAGGNNAGIRYIMNNNFGGDIMILNPDVIISRDTITEMYKALDDETGIVSVRTKNTDGKILYDAIRLIDFFQKKIITNQKSIPTDYAPGACMLIKREAIERIGFFDERFFLYWEEVDFSLRLQKTGFKCVSVTTTSIIRKKNSIYKSPNAFYYSIRNAWLIKKNHPELFSVKGYVIYILWMGLLSLKFIQKPKIFIEVVISYFSGLIDSARNKYGERDRL